VPVNGTTTEISITDLGKTSTLAIILGVILGVLVIGCCVGYFLYKRFREKQE
jgi:hypothetical protein